MADNELRLRAFAAYMPCVVVADKMEWAIYGVNHWDNTILLLIDGNTESYPADEHYRLLLTDLSEITDEDRSHCIKIVFHDDVCTEKRKEMFDELLKQRRIGFHGIDYLRSKSYNLPFMGFDLVKEGIAILKTK